MKKQLIIISIFIILLFSFLSYSVLKNNKYSATANEELVPMNREIITLEIERSTMTDNGYRFINAEYQKQLSSFATYYIREAKKCSGLISSNVEISYETKLKFSEKFLENSTLDITDVFCTISLIDNNFKISDKLKKNVTDYINSLYEENIGCYTLPEIKTHDKYTINIYPTFLVEEIATRLNLDVMPLENWLEEVAENVFKPANLQKEKSSAYVMLYSLMQKYNIDLPESSISAVKQMFEESLSDFTQLIDSDEIYLPVYLMDYLEFCLLTNTDSSGFHEQIIESICNEDGIKKGVIRDYDTYGLFATMRTLELTNFDFENCPQVNRVFDIYDTFMLDDSVYIAPGLVESNFVDTYYVNQIIDILDIDSANDIRKYCIENKEKILESDIISISFYLDLLQKNDMLNIVNDDKQEIINRLLSTWDTMLLTEEQITDNLLSFNSIIKALNILNAEWEIEQEQYTKIVDNFTENKNKQKLVYDLTQYIIFLNTINPENKNEIQEFCRKLEMCLIDISNDKDIDNKIILQSRALIAMKQCDYTFTNNLIQTVKETLKQSQDINGLFKGGDTNGDVVSFQSIYCAILLYELIN